MRTALTAADVLISPTRATQADLDAVAGLLQTVEGAQDFNENLKSMLVLNFVSSNVFTKDTQEAQSYLTDFPQVRLAQTVLHQRKAFADCLAEGKGVVEMHDSKAKAEIQLLTQEALSW
jgi:chromosome partitioning protein